MPAGLNLYHSKETGLVEERFELPVVFQKRLQVDLAQGAVSEKHQYIQARKRDHGFDAPQIPLFQNFLKGIAFDGR